MPSPPLRSPAPGHRGWRLAAWVSTAGLAGALIVPGEAVPSVGPVAEFAAHAAAFGLACGLWARALPSGVWAVAAVGLAWAVGSEVLQATVVPLRSGSATDAAANVVGLSIGLALARSGRRNGRG